MILTGISYPLEIDSPGYHTPGRLTHRDIIPQGDWLTRISYLWRLTHWDIIPRGDWLTGISHPLEIDSPGYHTPGRLTHWGIIPWGDLLAGESFPGEINLPRNYTPRIFWQSRINKRNFNQSCRYVNPLVSGPAGSNNEKIVVKQSCWTVPLRTA